MRTMVRGGFDETELLSLLLGTVFTIDSKIYASIAFRILEYFGSPIIGNTLFRIRKLWGFTHNIISASIPCFASKKL